MATSKSMLQDSGAMDYLLNLEQSRGIPAGTLSGIMKIESGGRPNLTSSKGAKGYFQFTKDTADAYGLKDPNDFQESARAAADYMKDNLKRYGTMDRALADYNGGPKAVAAYDAGKPFPETADYLQKFAGGSIKRGTATSGERLNPAQRSELATSENARFAAQQVIDKKFADESWGAKGSRIIGEISDSVVPNSPLYAGLAAMQNADPLGVNYQPTDAKRKEIEQLLPNPTKGELTTLYQNATSDAHLMSLMGIATLERERAARQAESGMGGVLGFNGVASLFDPVGLVIGGGAGKVFGAAKIANKALRTSAYIAEGAVSNAITESLFAGYNPQASSGDIMMAAGVGGLFGGVSTDGTLVPACAGCYATTGNYNFPNVIAPREFNRVDWQRDDWVDDMVKTLSSQMYFRWFDSGDVYHPDLALKILEVMRRTPRTSHWLPTRSHKVKKIAPTLALMDLLPNVSVRYSSDDVDGTYTPGLHGSTIIPEGSPVPEGVQACLAYESAGTCNGCRACWSKDVPVIGYQAHGRVMSKVIRIIREASAVTS